MANNNNTKISSDGHQRKAEIERRRSIRTIIASYQAEEEAFLKELEKMQAECEEENNKKIINNNLNSSEINLKQKLIEKEEPAMLGTLCTLLGEISKLQKQNKRLKCRLENKNKLKNKEENKELNILNNNNNLLSNYLIKSGCTAAICSLPKKLLNVGLPITNNSLLQSSGGSNTSSFCFPLQSSGGSTSCSSSAVSELFSRQRKLINGGGGGGSGTINSGRFLTMSGSGGSRGAQEQLSPLPPINKITTINNNLSVSAYSADLSSDSSGLCRRNFALNNQINYQPKLAESELFDDEWEFENCEKDLNNSSNFKHRRKMERRADEQQQQQQQFLRLSSSLTSGTSPSAGSSASSSVEPPINTNNLMTSSRNSLLELFGFGSKQFKKQLNNNQISKTFVNVVDNLVNNRKKRKKLINGNDENIKRHSTALENNNLFKYSQDGYSSSGNNQIIQKNIKIKSEPNLKENNEIIKQQQIVKYRNNKNNKNKRPQSCFLETKFNEENKILEQINNINRQQNQNSEIILEIQLLKSRNARLIEQLREKSALISSTNSKINYLTKELEQLKQRENFNKKIENIYFKTILSSGIEKNIKILNEKINKEINEKIKIIKLETQKYQQINLNENIKNKKALQESLEQVEKLQRKIFNLIQNNQENKNYFELIPSYDALYSFTSGIVKKLGQMRSLLSRKCFDEFQNELELNILKAQLLIANTQIERQRFQLSLLEIEKQQKFGNSTNKNSFSRSISFNGNSFIERIANSKIKYFLPFKLYGQRFEEKRKQINSGFDILVENNEQSIEMEFLRLFDSAWCLSRICNEKEENNLKIINNNNLIENNNFKIKIIQRRTQSGGNNINNNQNFKWSSSPPPQSPKQQKHQLLNNSPLNSPLFKFKRLNENNDFINLNKKQNNSFSPIQNNCEKQKFDVNNSFINRSRPILVRQNSTTKNEYDIDDENKNTKNYLISSKITENNQQKHQNNHLFNKPSSSSLLRPPTPSAPPISLLNSSIINSQIKLPQINYGKLDQQQLISNRFGFSGDLNNNNYYFNKLQNNFPPPTSSTRRPLTRSGACTGESRSPTPKTTKILNNDNNKSKSSFSSNSGGNRSASTSRLPKAVNTNILNQIDIQQQQNSSDQFSGQMPKAVKKAGTSWLSRLRRKSVSNTSTNN
uniref:Uncharacterized protein n=1 Tax=Meloidogyne hapla TaxID=6305 RepID=A0A1I8B8I9_MELHA